MSEQNIGLTPAEWNLMECLWESAPRTGREAAEHLRVHVGWTRSTTLTLLRRMTEKGILRCDEIGGIKSYFPLVRREDAVMRETEDFLSRVYKGSVSLMVNAITKKQALSQAEIEELYAILRRAEEAGK
ncbi:MAG: BlaI/MecI/CopY family transcriptional regulator [Clostridiales bacterium]|mgnify:CR=1 FL=1|nr:BlaI/MecI/CopY family transcriptional regulator [Clostridiales bacterium]